MGNKMDCRKPPTVIWLSWTETQPRLLIGGFVFLIRVYAFLQASILPAGEDEGKYNSDEFIQLCLFSRACLVHPGE